MAVRTCCGSGVQTRTFLTTLPNGDLTMRRVIVPALLAVAMIAFTSADANAGLFDWCNKGDSCCDVEPVCAAEPTCGCEAACEPVCAVEPDDCCDPCAPKKSWCLFDMFSKKHNHCDTCGCDPCEPVCAAPCEPACEMPCEPTCGCEAPAPICGCEDPCCGGGCGCGQKKSWCLFDMFSKKNNCCDTCGCDPCEPTCGCEAGY